MAHIETWDETTPLSSGLVSQGDDEIRTLKRATRERMEDFVADWETADPIVLKDDIVNPANLNVPGSAFRALLSYKLTFTSLINTIAANTTSIIAEVTPTEAWVAGDGLVLVLPDDVPTTTIAWAFYITGTNKIRIVARNLASVSTGIVNTTDWYVYHIRSWT